MILVVGVGHPLRGDDAAGWTAVDALEEQKDVRKILLGDDLTRLLDLLEGVSSLLIVDSVKSAAPAGTIHLYDLARPLPTGQVRFSTHALDPLQALELAERLGRPLPARRFLLGLEGENYRLGEPLSNPVEQSLSEFARRLKELIADCSAAGRRSERQRR